VAGVGVVARVVFRALAAGSGGLRFERAEALDAGLRPLALETRPAGVEVGGERSPAAPERPERPVPRPPAAKKTL